MNRARLLPPAVRTARPPAASAGERAREALLTELFPLVQRYCRARLGRRETPLGSADDIAQDVCLAVLRALPRYERRDLPVRAYVFTVAAHRLVDAHRAVARNRADPVADLPDTAAATGGPEALLLRSERSRQLDTLLHLLTPHQREVLVLRIAVGLTADETAAVLGCTAGGVRVTQHRALDRLRRLLRADPDLDGVTPAPDDPRWAHPA